MTYIPQTPVSTPNSRSTTDYVFDASDGTLVISAEDYVRPTFVYNLTNSSPLYNPLDGALGGKVNGRELRLEVTTSGMSDSDDLLVFYEALTNEDDRLTEIVNLLTSIHKTLIRIQNPR